MEFYGMQLKTNLSIFLRSFGALNFTLILIPQPFTEKGGVGEGGGGSLPSIEFCIVTL